MMEEGGQLYLREEYRKAKAHLGQSHHCPWEANSFLLDYHLLVTPGVESVPHLAEEFEAVVV